MRLSCTYRGTRVVGTRERRDKNLPPLIRLAASRFNGAEIYNKEAESRAVNYDVSKKTTWRDRFAFVESLKRRARRALLICVSLVWY